MNGGFSKIIPVWKFITLSLATFGIYELFWFYKQWKLLKDEGGVPNSPFWRSLFSPLYVGVLAGNIKNFLEERKIQCNYSSLFIGISYFILSASSRISNPLWLISLFSFVPIISLVDSINFYWASKEKNCVDKKFTWWQLALIVIGFICFLLSIVGTFSPE